MSKKSGCQSGPSDLIIQAALEQDAPRSEQSYHLNWMWLTRLKIICPIPLPSLGEWCFCRSGIKMSNVACHRWKPVNCVWRTPHPLKSERTWSNLSFQSLRPQIQTEPWYDHGSSQRSPLCARRACQRWWLGETCGDFHNAWMVCVPRLRVGEKRRPASSGYCVSFVTKFSWARLICLPHDTTWTSRSV